jgi:hypothetical protein
MTSASYRSPSVVTTASGSMRAIGVVTKSTFGFIRHRSQEPLSCRMRFPAGGYAGTDFSSRSVRSSKIDAIHAVSWSRRFAFDRLTPRPLRSSNSGSHLKGSVLIEIPGYIIKKRNQRP